jgi:hypothetical protein
MAWKLFVVSVEQYRGRWKNQLVATDCLPTAIFALNLIFDTSQPPDQRRKVLEPVVGANCVQLTPLGTGGPAQAFDTDH